VLLLFCSHKLEDCLSFALNPGEPRFFANSVSIRVERLVVELFAFLQSKDVISAPSSTR